VVLLVLSTQHFQLSTCNDPQFKNNWQGMKKANIRKFAGYYKEVILILPADRRELIGAAEAVAVAAGIVALLARAFLLYLLFVQRRSSGTSLYEWAVTESTADQPPVDEGHLRSPPYRRRRREQLFP